MIYWKGGEIEAELNELGIKPKICVNLEKMLQIKYFEDKYILHIQADALKKAKFHVN